MRQIDRPLGYALVHAATKLWFQLLLYAQVIHLLVAVCVMKKWQQLIESHLSQAENLAAGLYCMLYLCVQGVKLAQIICVNVNVALVEQ